MSFKANLATDPAFCRAHKKAKNGQDYIPWAVLLAEARQRHPDLSCGYGPIISHAGMKGLVVEAYAQVGDEPRMTAQLAVTDMKNRTIEVPDAAAVQNAQQRALAKAVSMATGIGLSLWFGDVQAPTGEAPRPPAPPATQEQLTDIGGMLDSLGVSGPMRVSKVSMAAGRAITKGQPLTAEEADRVVRKLAQELDGAEAAS